MKIKITEHGTTTGNSHHGIEKPSGCRCDPKVQIHKYSGEWHETVPDVNYHLYKLPYDGGILNDQGEYIPGIHCVSQNN